MEEDTEGLANGKMKMKLWTTAFSYSSYKLITVNMKCHSQPFYAHD